MRMFRRALVVRMAFAAFALVLVLVFAIRMQQYVLRFRAERLERDIASLTLSSTSFEQTQVLFRRWGAVFDDGPCEKGKCSAGIALGDFTHAHPGFLVYHQRLLRLYEILGGRPTVVNAHITILDGFVHRKSFSVYTDVSPCEAGSCGFYGYTLMGVSTTNDSIGVDQMSRHPSYRIGWPGGCEICVEIYARFTPQASPEDVERVGRLDFSCVTRWVTPCKTQADIMPGAWKQAEKDRQESSAK